MRRYPHFRKRLIASQNNIIKLSSSSFSTERHLLKFSQHLPSSPQQNPCYIEIAGAMNTENEYYSSPFSKNETREARPQNPFSRRGGERDNFPALDDFLEVPRSLLNQHYDHHDERATTQQYAFIESAPSFPLSEDGAESTSFLNISIGARAALAEHMRHIAHHGIDGEAATTATSEGPKTLLDLQWEQFLQDKSSCVETPSKNNSHASREEEHDFSMFSATSKSSTSPLRVDIQATTAACHVEQSIEVMTDVSYDYFTSARVKQLATPERNFGRTHYISTRRQEILHDDEEEEEDSFMVMEGTDVLAPELWMADGEGGPSNAHSSFHSTSFCAPDISRISSFDDDDSEPRTLLQQSPNNSFQLLQGDNSTPLAFPPVFENAVSQHPAQAVHTSFPTYSSTKAPPRTPPILPHFRPSRGASPRHYNIPSPLHAEASFDHHTWPPRQPVQGALKVDGCQLDKENGVENYAKAPHHETQVTSPPRKHKIGMALETMPNDFLQAIEDAHVMEGADAAADAAPLSPISQGGSHIGGGTTIHGSMIFNESSTTTSSSSRLGGGAQQQYHMHHHLRRNRLYQHRKIPNPPTLTTPPTHQDTSASTGSSSSLSGRKRFRTVVPRRVYVDSPSQFPDEQDSFGQANNTSSSGLSSSSSAEGAARGHHESNDRAQRSLLGSFEATILQEEERRR